MTDETPSTDGLRLALNESIRAYNVAAEKAADAAWTAFGAADDVIVDANGEPISPDAQPVDDATARRADEAARAAFEAACDANEARSRYEAARTAHMSGG